MNNSVFGKIKKFLAGEKGKGEISVRSNFAPEQSNRNSMPNRNEIIQKGVSNLRERLKAQGKELRCPVCGEDNFYQADGFVKEVLDERAVGTYAPTGVNIPEILLICSVCTYTLNFSAGLLGLFALEAPASSEETKEGKKDA